MSLYNSFSREAGDDLTQPMKVNALERALVEALADMFPRFIAVHQCARCLFL